MNTTFITRPTQSIARRAWNNKHTSCAALLIVGGEVVAGLTALWFPEYRDKMDASVKIIQKAAMGYGFFFAGDSRPEHHGKH